MKRALAGSGWLVGSVLAVGCATPSLVALPEPLRAPKPEATSIDGQALLSGREPAAQAGLQRRDTPTLPGAQPAVAGMNAGTALPPLRGQAINANIEGMPVPAFINEFFGSILGVGFQMAPAVAQMSELVTLRTSGPQSPQNFYRLATRILQTYGVSAVYEDGIVVFESAPKGTGFEAPLIVSGRSQPNVPTSQRPVFQLVELQTVRISDVSQWLTTAFVNSGLQIETPAKSAGSMLAGTV